MNKIKTVIVDDEEEAREGIRSLLENEDDISISAVAENGLEAISYIKRHNPDLLFLDIQMPEINGFEVLNSIEGDNLPAVIFVTAFDEYALQAFEVHALDYLLKPFTDERFFEALDHARLQLDKNLLDSRIKKLLVSYREEISDETDTLIRKPGKIHNAITGDRLIVKVNSRIKFLPLNELQWIEAQDYYVNLHFGKKSYLIRETMKEMEKQLPGESFIRIHKSTIVNMDFVKEMEPYFSGGYIVRLNTGEELKMSRGYAENISYLK